MNTEAIDQQFVFIGPHNDTPCNIKDKKGPLYKSLYKQNRMSHNNDFVFFVHRKT